MKFQFLKFETHRFSDSRARAQARAQAKTALVLESGLSSTITMKRYDSTF